MRWAIRLATLEMPPHHIVTKSTGALDLAREQTVEDALQTDPEWIFFVDSDVLPPVDAFQRLRRHDEPVVSGLYYMDGEQVHPAFWVLDEENSPSTVDIQDGAVLIAQPDGSSRRVFPGPNGLVGADAVGMGCLLVHRSVFDDLDRPWFRWTKGYDDHPWDLRSSGGGPGISEDFFFCHKLSEAGYEIYVDTNVRCAHEKGCLLTDEGLFLESQVQGEF